MWATTRSTGASCSVLLNPSPRPVCTGETAHKSWQLTTSQLAGAPTMRCKMKRWISSEYICTIVKKSISLLNICAKQPSFLESLRRQQALLCSTRRQRPGTARDAAAGPRIVALILTQKVLDVGTGTGLWAMYAVLSVFPHCRSTAYKRAQRLRRRPPRGKRHRHRHLTDPAQMGAS